MKDFDENELNEKEVQYCEDEEQEYFTKDEVCDIIEQITPKVEIDLESVQGLGINSQEFQAGIDSISYIAGQYSALRSVGIDSSSAIDIIVNERNIEFNLQINERQIKSQQTNQEQNQI